MIRFAVVGALLAIASLAGCGSSDDPPAVTDAGTLDASNDATDTSPRDSTPAETGDTGGIPSQGGTTGKPCTKSDECDVTGEGINVCSLDWFRDGSLFPTPVCFGSECKPSTEENSYDACDEGKGWCIEYTSSTRCWPRCSFAVDSFLPAVGCTGKNVCNWIGWSRDDAGKVWADGYCFGGCTADADCPTGHKCQTEYGECVFPKAYWTATKNVGDPCTEVDRGTSTKAPACSCWMNSKVGKGYCSEFCRIGDSPSTCPDGFTCDAQLPRVSSIAPFTEAAHGIAGACFKNCTTDDECIPLGGYCEEGVGTGRKTCQFGVRPGTMTDAGTD